MALDARREMTANDFQKEVNQHLNRSDGVIALHTENFAVPNILSIGIATL